MHIRSLVSRIFLALALCGALSACHKRAPAGPTEPEPPPVQAPSLTCPSDIAVDADLTPIVINYPAPTVTGGTAPITTTCTIDSGKAFPAGTSDVVCTATDSGARKAQCVFHVNVTQLRMLIGTRFLAYGDSLTEGEITAFVSNVRNVDPVNNYPTILQSLLQARYKKQTVTVINKGLGGERASCSLDAVELKKWGGLLCSDPNNSEQRLVDEIRRTNPDVLLLMEGTNDVHDNVSPEAVARSLSNDVRRARDNNVRKVYLATLPPFTTGRNAANPADIVTTNRLIEDVARRDGAELVDVFAAIEPRKDLLIGSDGLHPTVQGYRVIAETFMKAIQDTFEQPLPAPGSQGIATPFKRR
ncbi:MAG: SGNH/GDSL hydrolase family protein [Vicinamibacterales bacterium]